jgi:hypothetical protein
VTVPPGELEKIGSLIFRNECGGNTENLTAWNEGEEFASLGIGHFLWYPEGKEYPFHESFPSLFEFIKSKGAPVPEWMNGLASFDLPWGSRREFYDDFDSPRMVSLRKFMLDTVALQSLFIAERMENSLPMMLESAPAGSRTARGPLVTQGPSSLLCVAVRRRGQSLPRRIARIRRISM